MYLMPTARMAHAVPIYSPISLTLVRTHPNACPEGSDSHSSLFPSYHPHPRVAAHRRPQKPQCKKNKSLRKCGVCIASNPNS